MSGGPPPSSGPSITDWLTLAETGFRDNWGPNERGRALEDLIDELNRIRWRLQAARDS
jgi:hypothetical protein